MFVLTLALMIYRIWGLITYYFTIFVFISTFFYTSNLPFSLIFPFHILHSPNSFYTDMLSPLFSISVLFSFFFFQLLSLTSVFIYLVFICVNMNPSQPHLLFLLLCHSTSLAYFEVYWPALILQSPERSTNHFSNTSAMGGEWSHLMKFRHEKYTPSCAQIHISSLCLMSSENYSAAWRMLDL